MELTEKDREYLKSTGYLPEDLWQIEGTTWHCKVTLYQKVGEKTKKRKISPKKAMALLGREMYLSGIARATFHSSSCRECEDESVIMIERGN